MAERRMFSKSIVLSDAFLDMPMSARCLYFTLGMLADDEGFVGNAKSIMRQCGASNDDMNVLLAKRYVLGFESGVIVIKHWKLNNYLRNDRFTPTTYIEEKDTLAIDQKGAYTEQKNDVVCEWCVNGIPSIGKDSIGKDSIDKYKETKHKYGKYQNVFLTDTQLDDLKQEFPSGWEMWVEKVSEYCASTGKSYKNYLATIRNWAKKEQTNKPNDRKVETSYDVEEVRTKAQMPIEYKRKS